MVSIMNKYWKFMENHPLLDILLHRWRLTGICIDEDALVLVKYVIILMIVLVVI